MKIVKTPAGRSRNKPARTYAYPYEYRLRVVRLHLEEGYSRPLLAEQFGISTHSIQRWAKAYREHGEVHHGIKQHFFCKFHYGI